MVSVLVRVWILTTELVLCLVIIIIVIIIIYSHKNKNMQDTKVAFSTRLISAIGAAQKLTKVYRRQSVLKYSVSK